MKTKNILNIILNNKLIKLIIYFIAFIIIWIVLLNLILWDKFKFDTNYLILVHILAMYIWLYLFNYILSDENNNFIKAILSPRIIFWICVIVLLYTIIYIVIWDKEIAETLSINMYYLLILWVILEIIYLIFNKYDIDILKIDG